MGRGPAIVDLKGRVFGQVTVLRYSHTNANRRLYWLCRCACGKEWSTSGHALKAGKVISCGCLKAERIGALNRTHGMSRKHPAHSSWLAMKQRCTNPNHVSYHNYGAIGLTYCQEWNSFDFFWRDMGSSWSPGMTLERKNPNKGYEPGNCTWIPHADQAKNTRKTVRVDTPWGTMTLADAARKSGIDYYILYARLKNGWSTDRMFDLEQQEGSI
jgi:hypothetical protein